MVVTFRFLLLCFAYYEKRDLISPFRFVDCPLLASRRDAESKTTVTVTVFFTSLNLLYYTYEKYWFDEFLPEIRNCTSMCWSL